MNAYASPYAMSPQSVATLRAPRDMEYDAFSRVTAALKAAQSSRDVPARTAAVHQNNNLWNILLADLSSPGNGLPAELRANLVSLALFSVQHGLKVMSNTAEVEPLVDINLSIMRGLRGEGAQ